jgi:peptidyl-Asp metalloendopeptidase
MLNRMSSSPRFGRGQVWVLGCKIVVAASCCGSALAESNFNQVHAGQVRTEQVQGQAHQLSLFEPVVGAGELVSTSPLFRSRAVSVDLDALLATKNPLNINLQLNIFEDVVVRARVDRVESRALDSFSWSGTVLETGHDGQALEEGRFVLVVEQDALVVAVWLSDGRTFEVRSDQHGQLWSRELDQAKFSPCETGEEQCVHHKHQEPPMNGMPGGSTLDPAAMVVCDDNGTMLDVLIVYTPAARIAAGGTNDIVALAQASIDASNTAYAASNILTRLRLVSTQEISYTETGSNSTDLNRLRIPDDNFMDDVHQMRDSSNADIVAMLHDGPGCGIGYLMTTLSSQFESFAFSITRYTCAVGNLTMAHEIGHNQGSAHDRDNAGSSLYSYSFGHRWFSTNNNQYRSVMAYSPGSRVPRFSNPDVLYIGTPTGIATNLSNSAANAFSINNVSLVMSRFRNSGENTSPVITTEPADQSVALGETAIFDAEVSSLTEFDSVWRKDGQVVIDSDRISGAATPVLTIQQLAMTDAGMYQLTVTNSCGSQPTVLAELVVLNPPCNGDIADDFGTPGNDGQVSFGDFLALLGLIGPCA